MSVQRKEQMTAAVVSPLERLPAFVFRLSLKNCFIIPCVYWGRLVD